MIDEFKGDLKSDDGSDGPASPTPRGPPPGESRLALARRMLEERRKQRRETEIKRPQAEGHGLDAVKASLAAATDAVRKQRLENRKKQRKSRTSRSSLNQATSEMATAAAAAARAATGRIERSGDASALAAAAAAAARPQQLGTDDADPLEDERSAAEDAEKRALELHRRIEGDDPWEVAGPPPPIMLLPPQRPFPLGEVGALCCDAGLSNMSVGAGAVVDPGLGGGATAAAGFSRSRGSAWREAADILEEDGLAVPRAPTGIESLLEEGRCQARLARDAVAAALQRERSAKEAARRTMAGGDDATDRNSDSEEDIKNVGGGESCDRGGSYTGSNNGGGGIASIFFAAPGLPHFLEDPLLPFAVRRERPPAEDDPPSPPHRLRTQQLPPARGIALGMAGSGVGRLAFADGGSGGNGTSGGGYAELHVAVPRLAFHDHPLMGPEDRLYMRMKILFGQYTASLQSGEAEYLRSRLDALVRSLLQLRIHCVAAGRVSGDGGSESNNGSGGGGGGSTTNSRERGAEVFAATPPKGAAVPLDMGSSAEAAISAAAAAAVTAAAEMQEELDELGRLWQDALATLSELAAAEAEVLALGKRLRRLWGELQDQRREQRFVATPARLEAVSARVRNADACSDETMEQDAASGSVALPLDALLSHLRDLHRWIRREIYPSTSASAASTELPQRQDERLEELLESCRRLLPRAGCPQAAVLHLVADATQVTSDNSSTLPRSERARRQAARRQHYCAVLVVNNAVAARTPIRAMRFPDFALNLGNLMRLRLTRRPESVEVRIYRQRSLLPDEAVAAVFVPLPGGTTAGELHGSANVTTHALAPKAQWCGFSATEMMGKEGILASRRLCGAILVGMEWATGSEEASLAAALAPAADGAGAFTSASALLLPPPLAMAGGAAASATARRHGRSGFALASWMSDLWHGFLGDGGRYSGRTRSTDGASEEQEELLLAKRSSEDDYGGYGGRRGSRDSNSGPRTGHHGVGRAGRVRDAELLRLLPQLSELDPNDPANATALGLLLGGKPAAGSGVGHDGESAAGGGYGRGGGGLFGTWERERIMAFSGYGPAALAVGVAVRYPYTNPRRWRECARHTLLRLRQARPSLLPRRWAIPLLEKEIRADEAAQDLLDRFWQASAAAEGQDLTGIADATPANAAGAEAAAAAAGEGGGSIAPWAPEAGKARMAVDETRLQEFRARIRRARAAQSRTAAHRRATLAGVVQEIPPMAVSSVSWEMGSLLPPRRRALRPQPRPRAPGAVPITQCRLLVQVVSARNVPVRASEDAGGFAFAVAAGSAAALRARGQTALASAAVMGHGGGGQATAGANGGTSDAVELEGLGRGAAEVAEGRIPKPPNQVCSFVEVRFQQARRRTSCYEGRAPLWRETVELPFVPPAGSFTPSTLSQVSDMIRISLFDEVLFDDRPRGGFLDPEDEREGLRTEKHFLGTVTLPFQTVYMSGNGKVDALLRLEVPIVNLGYRQAREGNGNGTAVAAISGAAIATSDGAAATTETGAPAAATAEEERRQTSGHPIVMEDAGSATALRNKSERSTYIRIMATLDPLPERPPDETSTSSSVSGERNSGSSDAALARYARRWVESVQRSKHWPAGRQATAFVPDLYGDDVLLTRYLTPQSPPEGCDTVAKCAHFVRLVPFIEDWRAFEGSHDMWCTSEQFLDILAGDSEEHSILLHNYIAYLIEAAATRYRGATLGHAARIDSSGDYGGSGHRHKHTDSPRKRAASPPDSPTSPASLASSAGGDVSAAKAANAGAAAAASDATISRHRLAVYLVLGTGMPEGSTVYVMVRDIGSGGGGGATTLWNASTGEGYDAHDPRCPLTDVAIVASRANIWANMQKSGKPQEMHFNLDDAANWRPFFGWPQNPPPPTPPPTVQPQICYRPPDPALVYEVEELIREAIKREMRRWRARRGVTAFNAGVGNRLAELLPLLEAAAFAGGSDGDSYGGYDAEDHRRRLEPTLRSRDLVGFPLHFGFTDVDAALAKVRATGVHENRHPEAQFALAVQAFPYASNVLSVWIYVAAVTPR